MARIRSIHPGLFRDESYMSLTLAGKAAWPGIWTEADDHGVFEWKPVTLKATLLPADNVDMIALLDEYVAQGMVLRFTDRGKTFGVIKGFMKWQRPRQPSYRYPFPKEAELFARNCGSPDEEGGAEGREEQEEGPNEVASSSQPSRSDAPLEDSPLSQDYGSPATVPPTMAPQREEEGGKRKDSEEAKASSARGAPPDFAAVLFGACRVWLQGVTGKSDPQCRALLGKWRKALPDGDLVELLKSAQEQGHIEDPVPWIERAIQLRKGPPRRQHAADFN